MSARASAVVFARRRRRCEVRSGRAFRAAEYSSRRASLRERHFPPDSPSCRSRLPERTMGGLFLLPKAIRFSRSAIHSARSDASRSRW